MMEINGRKFEKLYPRLQIEQAIQRVAEEINRDLVGQRPIVVAILNGAAFFAVDLMRHLDGDVLGGITLAFTQLQSYDGTKSTGKVKQMIPLSVPVEGRNVLLVEDVLDSGLTLTIVKNQLYEAGAAKVYVVAMLYKPAAEKVPDAAQLDYCAFSKVPTRFLLGRGLDDENGERRELLDIWAEV